MLRNVNHKKILQALDRESRLALAFSACIILALDRRLGVKEAVSDACKVLFRGIPGKNGRGCKKV